MRSSMVWMSVVTAHVQTGRAAKAGARPGRSVGLMPQAQLALLVVAAPLLLLPNRAWSVGLLLVAPFLWALLRSAASASAWPPRLADAAALGLMVMGLAGAAASADEAASLPKLLGLAYATAVYGAIRSYVTGPERARTVAVLLSAAGLA